MKQKSNISFFVLAVLLLGVTAAISCTKNYITGGKITDVNQYKNKTTYETLSSLPQFDSLVQLIDAAGIKDRINQQNTTFFAVQNAGIYSYLNTKTIELQSSNREARFTFDSLLYHVQNNIDGAKDSLLLYLIPNISTTPANVTATGTIYPTALGDTAIISYEISTINDDGGITSSPIQVMYFTPLWQYYDLSANNPANAVPSSVGTHTLVSTSFMSTSNGVINVLTYSAPLFFYGHS